MKYLSLEKILDIEKWEMVQDSLSKVTQMAMITTNFKGVPITKHSGCNPFCAEVRKSKELAKRCEKCDARGGFEAVCSNKPFIYFCHYGLIDIAVPITIDERYVGAVLTGQVKLKEIEGERTRLIEQLHYSPTGINALNHSMVLQRLYDEVPSMTYERIEEVANMIFHLCSYIVDEAKSKKVLLDAYPKGKRIEESGMSGVLTQNSYILSVLDYIHANQSRMLSVREAAEFVHLSAGHFSRLFTREVGVGYVVYVTELKIKWAKQLLGKTELSVSQISEELGFSDSGYFIKTFKKIEKTTPNAYRKQAMRE